MKKKLIKVFLTSLIVLEIISFFFIYHSNQALYKTINMLKDAGYMVVPNDHVLSSLGQIMPAFYSSLFILSTAGILVSLIICLLAMLFYKTKFKNSKNLLTYFSVFLAVLMVQGLILVSLADKSIFLRTRDYLLLSNTPGIAINNFYYKYTSYAAQALNPPFDKQVKSCWIDPEIEEQENLARLLSRFGWFNTSNRTDTTFIIEKSSDNNLVFQHKKKTISSVSLKRFLQDPSSYLKEYSEKTDHAFFIRFLCAVGLFTGLPIFCFTNLFWFISLLCSKLMPEKNAMFLSGILVSGLTMISLLYLNPTNRPDDIKEIQKMLKSPKSKTRIEAVRILYHNNEDIWQFPGYCKTHVTSSFIAEKYWLANAFSKSNTIKSVQYLKKLLKDDSINVKCASIKALSKLMCNDESANIFKGLIITSPEWYVQQYAYNAFKGCQWKQIQ